MSEAVNELIPFKVEVVPFADLELPMDRPLEGFIGRMACSPGVRLREREFEKKMSTSNPLLQALKEVYTEWTGHFPGEWIVVGKVGLLYLAAQPKRVAVFLPIECCRFVGLLEQTVSTDAACRYL